MELFEIVSYLFVGALAGLGWSACWGSPPVIWGLFGMALFGMLTGTGALILTVRRVVR